MTLHKEFEELLHSLDLTERQKYRDIINRGPIRAMDIEHGFDLVNKWLNLKQKQASGINKFQYILCAAEAYAHESAAISFSTYLELCLNEHGFDRAEDLL